MDEKKFKELNEEVNFRTEQLNLMYNLLIKNQSILYPVIHLFGLTGTGKTFAVRKFMNKFCNGNTKLAARNQHESTNRYCVYINCNELFYASVSSLFNEILAQIKIVLNVKNFETEEINMSITYEESASNDLENQVVRDDPVEEDEEMANIKMNDSATFLGQLRRLFQAKASGGRTNLYLVFDNAESLKYFNEASNLLLTLSKLGEYINIGQQFNGSAGVSVCTLFVSEIEWHSLISECDLMSKTESPRPFNIYFGEYNKDQMYTILKNTAIDLLTIQENSMRTLTENAETRQLKSGPASQPNNFFNIEFYIKVILDVFFPICKDLNEIQYLIQIYYDQLLCSINSNEIDTGAEKDSYQKMVVAWNKMKPFLKQALTQIYLRQSMFNSTNASANKILSSQSTADEFLTREFENLNILTERTQDANMPNFLNKNRMSANQLPKLMKIMLISAYIATHNPAKYDKKLFEYNSTKTHRRSKFTAQKIQQNEENQRAAALKTQSFDFNRLMAIFFAICHENGHTQTINLSHIQLNLKTLKSLHYLQQSNSSYSSLDEPKYKCLIDFETILNLSNSVNFNIKQYLAEYITI
jgi:Cdc6-like AAA superfamily ATPase